MASRRGVAFRSPRAASVGSDRRFDGSTSVARLPEDGYPCHDYAALIFDLSPSDDGAVEYTLTRGQNEKAHEAVRDGGGAYGTASGVHRGSDKGIPGCRDKPGMRGWWAVRVRIGVLLHVKVQHAGNCLHWRVPIGAEHETTVHA